MMLNGRFRNHPTDGPNDRLWSIVVTPQGRWYETVGVTLPGSGIPMPALARWGLSGDYRAGGAFWASQRSLPKPG